MHVLRVVRVLLPVLIVAAVVFAGSSVLSARPDLQNAKRDVDTSWSALAPKLDARYDLLGKANDALRPIPGPIHTLVGEVDTALAGWHNARAHSGVTAQVEAANELEGLARRVVATSAASPRVSASKTALPALGNFLKDDARAGAVDFNERVTSYEHARQGPVRTLVASALGDGQIPVLDTSDTDVTASA